jgi:hypothetical protein
MHIQPQYSEKKEKGNGFNMFTDSGRNTLVTLVFLLFVTIPLWSNKTYYGDDFMRLASGDGSIWISNGRPLTTLLHYVLTFGTRLNDISPVPLLTGLIVLSFSVSFYINHLRLQLSPLQTMFLCLGIVGSPFLAQPLLYIWDSLSMLMASSLSLFAATRFTQSTVKSLSLTTALLFCTLMLYQAAINLFLAAVIITGYSLLLHKESISSFFLSKAAAAMIAVLLYQQLLAPVLIADAYSAAHSRLLSSDGSLITAMGNTFRKSSELLLTAFPDGLLLLVLVPVLMSALCILINLKKPLVSRHTYSVNALWYALLSCVLIPIMLPGVSLFLDSPVIAPRTLTAYGALTTFYTIILFTTIPRRLHSIVMFFLSASLLYSLVIMTAVFNTVIKEQDYLSSVVWMVKTDLQKMSGLEHVTFINSFTGYPGTQNSRQVFPLINAITPAVPRYTYSSFFLSRNKGLTIIKPSAMLYHLPPDALITESCDYRLFRSGATAVIDFRTGC